MVISMISTTFLRLDRGIAEELFPRAIDHVEVDKSDRPKAAALDQDRALVQDFGGLEHVAIGANERPRWDSPFSTSCSAMSRLSTLLK